ncbi:MAG TPA: ester cyclase [Thermoanaerobaculia bacterium]|jgi:steroid delta-isomerase-like uncharacterized protein|nr:ester cyclase [Thermoanaerobaculia bacterium]
MSESKNSALARRWFEEVWNVRREETVRELMAPVVEGHMEGGLEVHAPEDFIAGRRALLEAFPDFRVTVEAVIAQGDDVAVRWSASGTHLGGSLGFPASNRPAAFRGITWLTFRDGQIVKGWDAWNQGRLIADLQAP